jgi:hypothetical protein
MDRGQDESAWLPTLGFTGDKAQRLAFAQGLLHVGVKMGLPIPRLGKPRVQGSVERVEVVEECFDRRDIRQLRSTEYPSRVVS